MLGDVFAGHSGLTMVKYTSLIFFYLTDNARGTFVLVTVYLI